MNPYLGKKNWSDITREERLFCAELFFAIRGRESEFINWLNSRPGMSRRQFDESQIWEVGYEVCFYRDLLASVNKSVRQSEFSDKRTFDLCLFSDTDLVIIEAKAQGGFDSNQNEDFDSDREQVPELLSAAGISAAAPRISVIALASSIYFKNVVKYGAERAIPEVFDGHFSWRELFESYQALPAFERADAIYKN